MDYAAHIELEGNCPRDVAIMSLKVESKDDKSYNRQQNMEQLLNTKNGIMPSIKATVYKYGYAAQNRTRWQLFTMEYVAKTRTRR